MKKLKYFSLLVFLFCLTGCGYKDVYEKYQSTIDGLDHCTYETTDVFSGYSFEKYSMTFTMDANGIYLNGDPLYDLNKGYSITNQFGPPISLDTFDIKHFMSNLGSSGKCPKDIYLNVEKKNAEILVAKPRRTSNKYVVYHYILSDEAYKNGNSTNTNASNQTHSEDGAGLSCEYGIVDSNTNTVSESVYIFELSITNQDIDHYDYDFRDVYGNAIYSEIAPNYKTDLEKYNIMDQNGAITCPKLSISSNRGLILQSDVQPSDTNVVDLALTKYYCDFKDCNFNNTPIGGSDSDPYSCSYTNGNNEFITVEWDGTCTVTYPDGSKSNSPSGLCAKIGEDKCEDFFYNSKTKEAKMAVGSYSSWFNGSHAEYDTSYFDFVCGNDKENVDYYCSEGCNWESNRNIDCGAISEVIQGNAALNIQKYCKDPRVLQTLKFVGLLLWLAKILVPALIIIMGCIDFVQVIVASKDDEIKKKIPVVIKRVIAGVIIFFIPMLINFLFNKLATYNETIEKYKPCYTCVFDPNHCSVPEK